MSSPEQLRDKIYRGEVYNVQFDDSVDTRGIDDFHLSVNIQIPLPKEAENSDHVKPESKTIIPFPHADADLSKEEYTVLITTFTRQRDQAECWLTCSHKDARALTRQYTQLRKRLFLCFKSPEKEVITDRADVNEALNWLVGKVIPRIPERTGETNLYLQERSA